MNLPQEWWAAMARKTPRRVPEVVVTSQVRDAGLAFAILNTWPSGFDLPDQINIERSQIDSAPLSILIRRGRRHLRRSVTPGELKIPAFPEIVAESMARDFNA